MGLELQMWKTGHPPDRRVYSAVSEMLKRGFGASHPPNRRFYGAGSTRNCDDGHPPDRRVYSAVSASVNDCDAGHPPDRRFYGARSTTAEQGYAGLATKGDDHDASAVLEQ
jgi:hypothetical protein